MPKPTVLLPFIISERERWGPKDDHITPILWPSLMKDNVALVDDDWLSRDPVLARKGLSRRAEGDK